MDGYIMILLYIFKFNAPLLDVMSTMANLLKHHFTVGDQWKSESVDSSGNLQLISTNDGIVDLVALSCRRRYFLSGVLDLFRVWIIGPDQVWAGLSEAVGAVVSKFEGAFLSGMLVVYGSRPQPSRFLLVRTCFVA